MLGGIQDPIPINFLFSRQTYPLLFRLPSRITISDRAVGLPRRYAPWKLVSPYRRARTA
jgi:hypothetical protein